MTKHMHSVALVAATLTACHGSTAPNPATSLVAIGNSLTVHEAAPAIGWNHQNGMAATDASHDYAHLVGTALGVPVEVHNVASLEQRPESSLDAIAPAVANIGPGTDVVVELGDNDEKGVTTAVASAYGALLDAVVARKPHRIVCTSTWWKVDAVDAMERAACVAHGGAWVPIGDLFPVRADVVDPKGDKGVERHPHDPSMAAIAARVAAAFAGDPP